MSHNEILKHYRAVWSNHSDATCGVSARRMNDAPASFPLISRLTATWRYRLSNSSSIIRLKSSVCRRFSDSSDWLSIWRRRWWCIALWVLLMLRLRVILRWMSTELCSVLHGTHCRLCATAMTTCNRWIDYANFSQVQPQRSCVLIFIIIIIIIITH